MKTDWLKPLLLTGAFCLLSNSTTHAQIINGFTDAFAPENWTLSATEDMPSNGGYAEFDMCSCSPALYLYGADEFYADPDSFSPGPQQITASIDIFSPVTVEFDFEGLTYDDRGWGHDSFGYTIQRGSDLTTVTLNPPSGYNPVYGNDLLYDNQDDLPPEFLETVTLRPAIRVDLLAGDVFTFFVHSEDSLSGDIEFSIYGATTAVPEPGEWMALAGAGLMGFAGVRRWRQNKTAIKA